MGKVLFREEQSFSYMWNVFLLLPGIGITIGIPMLLAEDMLRWPMVRVILAVTLVLLVAGAWFMHCARLVTEVRRNELYVRLSPYTALVFSSAQIEQAYARTYAPIREYGGWGKRVSTKGRVLNISGNRGVQLHIRGEKPLLIGSQRAEALARAIKEARHTRIEP